MNRPSAPASAGMSAPTNGDDGAPLRRVWLIGGDTDCAEKLTGALERTNVRWYLLVSDASRERLEVARAGIDAQRRRALNDRLHFVRVGFGALLPDIGAPDECAADASTYRAKQLGKNRYSPPQEVPAGALLN